MSVTKENSLKYFIAFVPPPPVYEDALALKNYFKEKYNSKGSLNSPPHITLHMPFLWKEEKEKKLIEVLENFVRGYEPVKICVDNFASFPPRVIFLNVLNSEELISFQKDLQRYVKKALNLFNANYREQPFHPHITLAFRDLKKPAYKEAWDEFRNKEFKAEFIGDKLSLMKHNGKIWTIYREFTLTSSYSTDQQKELENTEG